MVMSNSTIITIGTILLVMCIVGIAQKAFSTAFMVLGVCILLIAIIQSTSDVVLIDFANLADFAMNWIVRLFHWAQDVFFPMLTDVARDIENAL